MSDVNIQSVCVPEAKMSTGIFEVASIQGADFVAHALTSGRSEGTTIVKSPDRTFIAKIAHNVNRAYCLAIGDDSQPKWEDAPDWQKDSAINGVNFHMANEVNAEASHESWLKQKETEGWTYGPVKDVEKKEHPCFLPYAELPKEQQVKDYLFKAVVDSFK